MTGNELAAAVKKHKGPVFITASFEPQPFISAVKKDLTAYFSKKGNVEMFLKINAYLPKATLLLSPTDNQRPQSVT